MAWSIHFLPPSPPSTHPSFHLANLKLCTFEMVISHPFSQPLGNHCAFRLYDFNYSSTSFQWIQCIFLVCLLPAHCSQHNVSKDLSYVVYIRITFLSKANIALYVCTTFCLPIYLSVDCNLGCFYLWLLWVGSLCSSFSSVFPHSDADHSSHRGNSNCFLVEHSKFVLLSSLRLISLVWLQVVLGQSDCKSFSS